jgi:Spirocyclase AveC-like
MTENVRTLSGPAADVPEMAGMARRRWLCAPVFWAVFGVVVIGFQAWVFTRWIADGDAHPVPFGGEQMPTGLKIGTYIDQAVALVGCILLVVVAWWQSRKAGRVALAGALVAGYLLAFWSDPYSGAVHHAGGQNRYGLNVLTWGPYLPGWHGPMPQIETFLVSGGYLMAVYWVGMGLGIAALIRRWRPGWNRAAVAAATVPAAFLCDMIMEQAYMRAGGYAYPRALPHLTFFEGHWYQLPLTSPLSMVFLIVMPVVLMRLYTTPGAEVWLLEGSLNLPYRAQPWIRLLAGVGFANACWLAFQLVMLLASLVSYPIGLPTWLDRPPG